MCVCVCVPKQSVGRRAPVGDVVEKHLQLVVIVKVCSDDGAHRRRHGELLRGDILETTTRHGNSAARTHTPAWTSTPARTAVPPLPAEHTRFHPSVSVCLFSSHHKVNVLQLHHVLIFLEGIFIIVF